MGNLVSGNRGPGITVSGIKVPPIVGYTGYPTSISGNKIGTDVYNYGGKSLGNAGAGVIIVDSTGVVVGGDPSYEIERVFGKHVVSGNAGNGILFRGGKSNTIFGNLIGLSADGLRDLGNGGHGIEVDQSPQFVIRGISGAMLVVSGHGGDGIFIHDTFGGDRASGLGMVTIDGILVGTNSTGAGAMGNDGDGIRIVNDSGLLVGGYDSVGVSGNHGKGFTIAGSSDVSIGQRW